MSDRKRVMVAFGTRPEAIKMAPLCHALLRDPKSFETIVCVTGQHRDMLDQVLRTFDLSPTIDLDVMRHGQDLAEVTSAVLIRMRDVLSTHRPDVLLVHGDTTTSMAAALAGFYLNIPIAHVEAGLRTFDLAAPFPEEFNRQVAGKLASIHFAPTEQSRQNLLREGVRNSQIHVTGNTVIDSLRWILRRINDDPVRLAALQSSIDKALCFDWRHSRFVLVTGHRRENFGAGFLQICRALTQLAADFPDVHFVYPVHLNPNVLGPVTELLTGLANVHLISPQEYEPFVMLLQHCHLVLTDSGGIQEEAPGLGKPVLVMRDVTERPEAIAAGTVRLVGANQQRIIDGVSTLLAHEVEHLTMCRAHNPYGDGHACSRIVEVLKAI